MIAYRPVTDYKFITTMITDVSHPNQQQKIMIAEYRKGFPKLKKQNTGSMCNSTSFNQMIDKIKPLLSMFLILKQLYPQLFLTSAIKLYQHMYNCSY